MNVKRHTKHYLRFILPLIALTFFFSSCSQDDDFDNPDNNQPVDTRKGKQVGDLIINEASVLLTVNSIEKISKIEDSLVIFESAPEQADEIKTGAILVGVKNDNGIKNILGKVTTVDIIDGEWHVGLSPVAIEEFIYSGSISGTIYPMLYDKNLRSVSDVFMIQDVEGFPSYALFNNSLRMGREIIKFPRIEYDKTFSIAAPIPVVDLESSLSFKAGFTPAFEYNIQFGWTGIKEFKIKIYAQEILLDSHLNAYAGLKFDLSVADMYSLPIVPIVLGPTGLVISPTVSAGPYLHVDAGSSIDIKLFHVEGDISYTLTDPLKLPEFNLYADPYDWSNIQWGGMGAKAKGGLHLSAGFSLTFLTLNIASVGGSSKIGVGAAINMNDISKVNLNIYGNVNADARIVLGTPPLQIEKAFPIVNWNPTIYENEFVTGW